ncbi:MAG: dihydroorotase [Bacteroidaceae bacterium]
MKRILIYNAHIVGEGRTCTGWVQTEGEVIAAMGEGEGRPAVEADECIDAGGHYLLPGLIDDHVHCRQPGLTHKADLATESRAAAAGGVTSFMDMPNVVPPTTSLELLDEKFELAARTCVVNYSFYFGATNTNHHLLSQLDRRHVCGVKLFMGSSTGNMLVDREEALLRVFGEAGMLIAAHCEDPALIRTATERIRSLYGDQAPVSLHPSVRNEEACYASSALAVRLARQTGARLHLLHISTARELELLSEGPLEQKRITAEACVPHLLFSQADYATLGSRIKCNPAVKRASDREALREAVRSGLIDVVATDHAPHLPEEKRGGALKALSGMPMVQYSLVSLMELVHEGVFSIEQVVQRACHAPALLFGIERRGFIRPGYQADLVLLDPDQPWTLTSDDILSRCGWSPLEGRTFHARVEKTFVNGHLIYDGGIADACPCGQALTFSR